MARRVAGLAVCEEELEPMCQSGRFVLEDLVHQEGIGSGRDVDMIVFCRNMNSQRGNLSLCSQTKPAMISMCRAGKCGTAYDLLSAENM